MPKCAITPFFFFVQKSADSPSYSQCPSFWDPVSPSSEEREAKEKEERDAKAQEQKKQQQADPCGLTGLFWV